MDWNAFWTWWVKSGRWFWKIRRRVIFSNKPSPFLFFCGWKWSQGQIQITLSLLQTYKAASALPPSWRGRMHLESQRVYSGSICTYCNTMFQIRFLVWAHWREAGGGREIQSQMVGESSASSILWSAEYKLAGLTARQSKRPRGQDLQMTALSPPLWYLCVCVGVIPSLVCNQRLTFHHHHASPRLSSTKQTRWGRRRKILPPAANVSPPLLCADFKWQ